MIFSLLCMMLSMSRRYIGEKKRKVYRKRKNISAILNECMDYRNEIIALLDYYIQEESSETDC